MSPNIENEEKGMDIIFTKPRQESSSMVLTIPKHIVDKLRIHRGTRLDLIFYNSFVILKQREGIDYEKKPTSMILDLLDKVFDLFRQEEELKRKRYDDKSLGLIEYDSRMKEIHETLEETGFKISKLIKDGKWIPQSMAFTGEFRSVEEILSVLRLIYNDSNRAAI
jgi:hypothetical protein